MISVEELVQIKEVLKETDLHDLLKKIEQIEKEAKKEKRYLWWFYWDCGYGDIEGIFKATEEEIEQAIDKRLYFGERLGKHSEIHGIFEKDDIQLLSDNPLVVMGAKTFGYNPLFYLK